MKFPSLFTKTPNHKRFSFTPRHYDPVEEQRKEREERIRKELSSNTLEEDPVDNSYRTRITGSFRTARKTQGRQSDPSANMIRLIILTFLSVWVIAYLNYGSDAIYALLLFIPFYLWLKFIRK